jgi:hypothetical protein
MKLQMKREALEKMNRQASEMPAQGTPGLCTAMLQQPIRAQFVHSRGEKHCCRFGVMLESPLE